MHFLFKKTLSKQKQTCVSSLSFTSGADFSIYVEYFTIGLSYSHSAITAIQSTVQPFKEKLFFADLLVPLLVPNVVLGTENVVRMHCLTCPENKKQTSPLFPLFPLLFKNYAICTLSNCSTKHIAMHAVHKCTSHATP